MILMHFNKNLIDQKELLEIVNIKLKKQESIYKIIYFKFKKNY